MENQESDSRPSILGIPPGVRFRPSAEEIFQYYLRPIVTKTDARFWWIRDMLKYGKIKKGVDILQAQPWLLPGMDHETEEGYYIYQREMQSKAKGAKKCNRGIKDNTNSFWRMSSTETVMGKTGPGEEDVKVWGTKNTLNHHLGPKKSKTQWLMYEYVLDSSLAPSGSNNLVLCKIYSKKDDRKKEADDYGGGNNIVLDQSGVGQSGLKRKRDFADSSANCSSSVVESNSVDIQIQQSLMESTAMVPLSDDLGPNWGSFIFEQQIMEASNPDQVTTGIVSMDDILSVVNLHAQ